MILLARDMLERDIAMANMAPTCGGTAKRLATIANIKPAFLKPTLDGTTVFEVY